MLLSSQPIMWQHKNILNGEEMIYLASTVEWLQVPNGRFDCWSPGTVSTVYRQTWAAFLWMMLMRKVREWPNWINLTGRWHVPHLTTHYHSLTKPEHVAWSDQCRSCLYGPLTKVPSTNLLNPCHKDLKLFWTYYNVHFYTDDIKWNRNPIQYLI